MLGSQVGDYNIVYQELIAVMTYLPVDALYGYKILSIIFDFVLAGALGKLTYSCTGSKEKALVAYALTICLPAVFLDSAAWAQCDSIYVSFVVIALVLFFEDKPYPAFFVLGIAFAFKVQTIFIIPFVVFYYLKKKSFSILGIFLMPVAMFVVCIPGLLAGRSVIDIFLIYVSQVESCSAMSLNYPGFWVFFYPYLEPQSVYGIYKYAAIGFDVFMILLVMIYLYSKTDKRDITRSEYVFIAYLITFVAVFFLPNMHERYGYLYEMLSIALLILCPSTFVSFALAVALSLMSYGTFLVINEYSLLTRTFMSLAVILINAYMYARVFLKPALNGDKSLSVSFND